MSVPALPAPGPLYLRLSVTDRCNYRCPYCRPARPPTGGSQSSYASDAELVELVRLLDRTRAIGKLRLTGGEPLLRPRLIDLVKDLRELLPAAVLALTTNGSRLAAMARPLRAAGLDALNVSLDTVDAEAFADLTGGRLDDVLAGIRAARDAGFAKLKLNSVLMRRYNGSDVPALVRLAADLGCEIRFIELMPCGPGASLFESDFFSAEEALAALKAEFVYQGELPRSDTAQRHRFVVDGREATVGLIASVSHPFCRGCNRLRLDCRGRLVSCLRSQRHVDLLTPLRQGLSAQVAEGVDLCLAAKRLPGDAWPQREMVLIGG